MNLPALPAEVGQVRRARALGGGDIARVWRAELTDGRNVVIKQTPTEAALEADGLAALAQAGAAVPQVLAVEDRALVLEALDSTGDPSDFGRMLARVHRSGNDMFGWHHDNVIGPLPQANPFTEQWPPFFIEQRIRPYLDDLDSPVRARIQAAMDSGQFAELVDHEVVPSLVHGDLWSGNVLGWRWMIDPAVYYGDREVDLAMLALFGAVPETMLSAYEQVWPLDTGWKQRRAALQLSPLLVHVRLFGASYVPPVIARLDALGW